MFYFPHCAAAYIGSFPTRPVKRHSANIRVPASVPAQTFAVGRHGKSRDIRLAGLSAGIIYTLWDLSLILEKRPSNKLNCGRGFNSKGRGSNPAQIAVGQIGHLQQPVLAVGIK